MSLFNCGKCGHVENTAMAPWYGMDGLAECTQCHDGEWHGEFTRHVRGACPDCGPVTIYPKTYSGVRCASGVCKQCGKLIEFSEAVNQ